MVHRKYFGIVGNGMLQQMQPWLYLQGSVIKLWVDQCFSVLFKGKR